MRIVRSKKIKYINKYLFNINASKWIFKLINAESYDKEQY